MKTSLRIGGSLILVTLVAWRLDWVRLGQAFRDLQTGYFFLAFLTYVLAQILSSWRWMLLARPLGFDDSFGRFVSIYFTGMFFNLILPTSIGGDVIRTWYLADSRSGPRPAHPEGRRGRLGSAALCVLAERGSGLAVLLCMALFAGFQLGDELPPRIAWMLAVPGCALAGGLFCLPFLPLLTRLPKIGPRFGKLLELSRVYLGKPGLLAFATVLSIGIQFANVVQGWLLARGLGLDISLLWMAIVIPLVTLLTLLPLSVNGIGLREVGMTALLAPVGVPAAVAVTLSLLLLAVAVLASLFGGICYLVGSKPLAPREAGTEAERLAIVGGSGNAHVVGGDSDQGRAGQSATAA